MYLVVGLIVVSVTTSFPCETYENVPMAKARIYGHRRLSKKELEKGKKGVVRLGLTERKGQDRTVGAWLEDSDYLSQEQDKGEKTGRERFVLVKIVYPDYSGSVYIFTWMVSIEKVFWPPPPT